MEPNAPDVGLDELQKFFKTFDQNVYRVVAGGRCAPPETLVESVERSLDWPLPPLFRDFTMSPLGGLYIEVREDLWPRPKVGAKPTWRHEYGLKIFGLSVPIPEWLDLREEILRLPDGEGDLVPFMARTGAATRYCFDLEGNIVAWSTVDGRRATLKGDFVELVLRELTELGKRHARAIKPKKIRKRSSS